LTAPLVAKLAPPVAPPNENVWLRPWSHQSILLSVVGESSDFDYNIRIQGKMAINFEALHFALF